MVTGRVYVRRPRPATFVARLARVPAVVVAVVPRVPVGSSLFGRGVRRPGRAGPVLGSARVQCSATTMSGLGCSDKVVRVIARCLSLSARNR